MSMPTAVIAEIFRPVGAVCNGGGASEDRTHVGGEVAEGVDEREIAGSASHGRGPRHLRTDEESVDTVRERGETGIVQDETPVAPVGRIA